MTGTKASERAYSETQWDQEVDVLVAGNGIGGLGTAVIAAANGAETLVAGKAPTIGGTTAKSAAYMWIPNNKYLRETGRADPRPDALRYMAKLAKPRLYDRDSLTLGLPEWGVPGHCSVLRPCVAGSNYRAANAIPIPWWNRPTSATLCSSSPPTKRAT